MENRTLSGSRIKETSENHPGILLNTHEVYKITNLCICDYLKGKKYIITLAVSSQEHKFHHKAVDVPYMRKMFQQDRSLIALNRCCLVVIHVRNSKNIVGVEVLSY